MKQMLAQNAKPVCILLAIHLFYGINLMAQDPKLWLSAGHDLNNTHHASFENKISPSTVGGLQVKWEFITMGDVSATPAVEKDYVYFPDWAGYLYKVEAATGAQVWRKQIKEYTGKTFSFARATPAISGNTLVIGTQLSSPPDGAYVLGIDKRTGALLWKTKVENHFAAIVTQSAIIQGNNAYVGVASQEEGFAAGPGYPCCSFRGSMLSLDINTGAINWKTYIAPEGKGFSGNAIWGSTAVVDVKRNAIYVATGNNYTVPQAVLNCVAAGGSPAAVKACIMAVDGSAQNYFDAIMAFDLKTGAVKWANSVIPFDAWTVDCFFDGPNCPDNAGPDYDFGQGPSLFTVGSGSNKRELLGAGQKSGIYWALNPDNGEEVWHTQVGPGGTLGGLQWGSAVDDKQVYTPVSNNNYEPFLLTKGPGAGTTVKGGFWAALNAETGTVNWQYAATNPPLSNPFTPAPPGAVAINTGMVSIANGVLFGGAMDAVGTMYAFNSTTGAKLWSFESGGSVNSGAAIVDGTVYWGSGYQNFGLGTPNNKLYAFGLTGAAASSKTSNPAPVLKATDETISLYPTPANDIMNIQSKDNSDIVSIRLFDLNGKLIKNFVPNGSYFYQLNLGAIAAGTYIINIVTTTNSKTSKIIVVH